MSQPDAKEIAERIINFDKTMYESNIDVGLKHTPPDTVTLARAYLELEKHSKRLGAALRIALDALPCDSGVEAGGEQCDYCYARDRVTEILSKDDK